MKFAWYQSLKSFNQLVHISRWRNRCKENGLRRSAVWLQKTYLNSVSSWVAVLSLDCIKEEVINRRIKCQGQQVFPLINGNGSELRARDKTRYYWEITLTSFRGSCSLHWLPFSLAPSHTDASIYMDAHKLVNKLLLCSNIYIFYLYICSIDQRKDLFVQLSSRCWCEKVESILSYCKRTWWQPWAFAEQRRRECLCWYTIHLSLFRRPACKYEPHATVAPSYSHILHWEHTQKPHDTHMCSSWNTRHIRHSLPPRCSNDNV